MPTLVKANIKSEFLSSHSLHSLLLSNRFGNVFHMVCHDGDSCVTRRRQKERYEIDLQNDGKRHPVSNGRRHTIITASVLPTPSPTSARTSSGTFLATSNIALAEEWDQMTGARLSFSACRAVASDVWERSISMPSRFISRTSNRPKSLGRGKEVSSSPFCFKRGI